MLADFHIHRLSNDVKLAVHTNHLVGQILYRSLVPSKKLRQSIIDLTWIRFKFIRPLTP